MADGKHVVHGSSFWSGAPGPMVWDARGPKGRSTRIAGYQAPNSNLKDAYYLVL